MADAKPDYSKEDLLTMFSFAGGVAKYVNQLVDAGALDKDALPSVGMTWLLIGYLNNSARKPRAEPH